MNIFHGRSVKHTRGYYSITAFRILANISLHSTTMISSFHRKPINLEDSFRRLVVVVVYCTQLLGPEPTILTSIQFLKGRGGANWIIGVIVLLV